jgi:hypothetical protein
VCAGKFKNKNAVDSSNNIRLESSIAQFIKDQGRERVMIFDHRRLCLAVALLGVNMPIYALDLGSDMFSLRGYGTVGAVHSSYDQADFKTDASAPTGAGRSHDWSFGGMSKLGLQLDAELSQKWSSSIQVLSEYGYSGNYKPDIQNAYVKYQYSPSTSYRVGRFRPQQLYMLTEFTRVGFAFPWARPPLENYKSFGGYDGGEFSSTFSASDVLLTLRGFAGQGFLQIKPSPDILGLDFKAESTWGLSLTGSLENWEFFGTHVQNKNRTEGSPSITQVLDVYRNSNNTDLQALAQKYAFKGKTFYFDGVGVSYDPQNWFARAEWSSTRFDTLLIGKNLAAYVTAGVRLGAFTPYVIYGREKYRGDRSAGATDTIGAFSQILAGNDASRHSVSAGVRWDFKKDMDFKLQFTQVRKDTDTSSNGLTYQSSGTTAPKSYNLIFAGIDFVF